MVDQPLPIQESDQSDCDSERSEIVYWVVRVTPHGKFTFSDFFIYVQDTEQFCRYVLSIEKPDTPEEHYHMVVGTDESVTEQDMRMYISDSFIRPYWVVQKKDGSYGVPRGYGCKQYHLDKANDLDKAVSYACKDKKYYFEGFPEDYIASMSAQSFTKVTRSGFKTEYQEYCLKFQQDSSLTVADFMEQVMLLKAKYGQGINMYSIEQLARSNLVRRDPGSARGMVDNFLRVNKW